MKLLLLINLHQKWCWLIFPSVQPAAAAPRFDQPTSAPPPPSGAIGSDSFSTVIYLKIWKMSRKVSSHMRRKAHLHGCAAASDVGPRREGGESLRFSIKGRSERQFIKNYWDIWTSHIKSLSRAQTSSVWGLNRSHLSSASLLDCRRVCNRCPPLRK